MKFLAVCGFGVGSSMVLKMTLEKVARKMGIDAEVENTDLSTAKGAQVDAIFTSQELADELRTGARSAVIPIKRYMDANEVEEALQKFLAERG